MRARRLVDAITAHATREAGPLHLRFGTISATPGGGVVTITLGGSTKTGIHYDAGYTPGVNDVVWILQQGSDLLVGGKVA